MDITAIRKGIQTLLATINDPNNTSQKIRTAYRVPDNVQLPMAFVSLPAGGAGSGNSDIIEYDLAYAGGSHMVHMMATVLVTPWDPERGQDLLDPYLGNGANSIFTAIHSDRTLGGLAVDVTVKRATNYGAHEVAGGQYMGCQFHLEILVNA